MADEIQKKVLLEVDFANDDANTAVVNLKNNVDALKASLIANKESISNAKAAQAELGTQLQKNKLDHQNVKKAIDEERLARLKANEATRQSKQDYQAAAGSYDEAQKKLTALGRAIKSAEGGFKSSDPAIKQQIQSYKQLNAQLKAFDAQMGNHQRKVGQYENALKGIGGVLGNIFPSFNQFSALLQNAARGFNGMSTGAKAANADIAETGVAAEGAEAGVGGLSSSMIGLIAAGIGVALMFATVIGWIAKLTPHAESIKRTWSGLGGIWRQFMSDIADDTDQTWGQFISKLGDAYTASKNLTQGFQDLARETQELGVANANADAKIADLQLKMRNRRISPAQEKDYFDQIQKISNDSYAQRKDVADKEYDLAVRAATIGRNFTDDEILQLKQKGIAYATYLDKLKGLANKEGAGTDIAAIAKAQEDQAAAERFRNTVEDRAQNRLDARNMKAEAAAEKAKEDLLEAQRANAEILNERKVAIAKMLQDEMESFGKELSTTDEHYRQLIFKQQDFIKKQEQLRLKTKSPGAKSQYSKNISDANDLIGIYSKENQADTQKLMIDYFRKQADLVQKGNNELAALQTNNIQNVRNRELTALDQQYEVETQGYIREQELLKENIVKLQNELKTAHGDEFTELKEQLAKELNLQGINYDKGQASLKKYNLARAKIIRDADQESLEAQNKADILANEGDNGETSSIKLAAEKKEITDRYEFEISEAARAGKNTVLLKQQELKELKDLQDAYNLQQYDKAVQWEQLVQNSATEIIRNAINSNAQYTQANLERQKTGELNNQSLTTTQKQIINEKYRIAEGKAAQRAFKANQKLQEANAIINLMVALGRLWVFPGFPEAIPLAAFVAAQSAGQIAAIAAQRPPAYATGGLHYVSDGTGGMLRGPGTGKSDSMNARLSNGESVINAKSTGLFAPLLSLINQAGGGKPFASPSITRMPGYATGGVFNTYMPTIDSGMRPTLPISSRIDAGDLNNLASTIGAHVSDAIMNAPSPMVDVKDIAYQQQRLATVTDKSTY